MGFIRLLGALLIIVALALGVLFVVARFSDGPLELVAGGPFTTGDIYRGPEPDWSFVADRPTIQFQLVDPPRSRTAWIIEHDGRIFIPCGYMDTVWGRLWKQWPIEAEKDGRALLRIDGTIYPRQLERVQQGPDVAAVVAKLAEKYKMPVDVSSVESGSLWLFEMAPPSS